LAGSVLSVPCSSPNNGTELSLTPLSLSVEQQLAQPPPPPPPPPNQTTTTTPAAELERLLGAIEAEVDQGGGEAPVSAEHVASLETRIALLQAELARRGERSRSRRRGVAVAGAAGDSSSSSSSSEEEAEEGSDDEDDEDDDDDEFWATFDGVKEPRVDDEDEDTEGEGKSEGEGDGAVVEATRRWWGRGPRPDQQEEEEEKAAASSAAEDSSGPDDDEENGPDDDDEDALQLPRYADLQQEQERQRQRGARRR
jgi:hypothetical protein